MPNVLTQIKNLENDDDYHTQIGNQNNIENFTQSNHQNIHNTPADPHKSAA